MATSFFGIFALSCSRVRCAARASLPGDLSRDVSTLVSLPLAVRQLLSFSHMIYSLPGDSVEGDRLGLVLQYVGEGWDQLECQGAFVPHIPQGSRDLCEVYVAETWGEAVGVGEVHMVQEVSEGADGRWDRALLDVHVKGIGHDAAVRKACLPPHPHALVEPVEHVGAIAVPALQREVDTEGGGVLANSSYSLYGPLPLIVRIGDGLDARVRGRGDDKEWGSELGGELGDLTQVSHGDVSNVSFGVGQIAFRGEVRAH